MYVKSMYVSMYNGFCVVSVYADMFMATSVYLLRVVSIVIYHPKIFIVSTFPRH